MKKKNVMIKTNKKNRTNLSKIKIKLHFFFYLIKIENLLLDIFLIIYKGILIILLYYI